ncbi:VOC family protein [Saccharomonospora iraqiensis]|uniref:VOC family protein n=1 Tax=Saccharomonospora iraqiensis TaxID=52698 RepID=UPI00022E24B9|nr:VOC family protein [Saccharomonospora iraqiensis]
MRFVQLENIVWDAREPRRLGAFWAAALGAEPQVDLPDHYEARLSFADDFFLDLCFQPVATPSTSPARLHLDLAGGARQGAVVERLLALGAVHADIGQGEVPWVVLADPEGNAFCVMEHRDSYVGAEPIAALPLDSAAPERDAAFWSEITGWLPVERAEPAALRHPSGRGPLLEFCPEPEPKRGKNRLHLDVRSDGDDDTVVDRLERLGARPVSSPSDGLPWTVFADPSGNEFCVLPPVS